MRWVNIAAIGPLLAASPALAAQDALDRTNPEQQLQRDNQFAPEDDRVRIEVQPVLATPALASTTGPTLDIGAIVIDGLTELGRNDFASVIEPYAGRSLSRAELEQLTDSIASRAREKGYILATAWIPQQALIGGMLRVRVDEGMIDEVRVEGSDDPAIQRQLRRLVNGRPITLAALQREVLLADDLPGVWVRRTRFETKGQRRILVVNARREDFAGSAQVSTDGTKPVGPIRARINLDANGLISPRDRVDLSFSTTPLDPSELEFVCAR